MIGAIMVKRTIPAAFEALNRHDLEAFMEGWTEDGIFVYPGNVSASGKWEGKQAIQEWFQRFFEQFPSIRFRLNHVAIENQFDFTGNNTACVHWDVELINKHGYEAQNSGVTVVTIRGREVVAALDFIFNTGEIFRRAWSEEAEAVAGS